MTKDQKMAEDKTRLTTEQIDDELRKLDGWARVGIFLKKDFIFANFKEINTFLPHLASTIVELNHHPDFSLSCAQKKISIKVTTHSEGWLTKSDLDLARTLEKWIDL